MPGVGRIAGILQGLAQSCTSELLHAAVGQPDVALFAMDGIGPTGGTAGDELKTPFSGASVPVMFRSPTRNICGLASFASRPTK